ncbi:hypothetical protein L7F22_004850 [Adiantum nelumboides]|nr:hypothetical protein [Adiantum nelumboides]
MILRSTTVEQLMQQLHVWRGLSAGEQCSFDWAEPWEQVVMDEIFLFENTIAQYWEKAPDKESICEKLARDGILLSQQRVEQLKETYYSLQRCRRWSPADRLWDAKNTVQWKQDWLKSCKVCMAMQVLGIVLDQELDLQAISLHRQWFTEMMQEVDLFFQHLVDKLLIPSVGFKLLRRRSIRLGDIANGKCNL